VLVRKLSISALILFAALYFAGCGGHSKTSGGNQNPALTINAVTLPVGYAGANYTPTTLKASGGSGSGYAWSVSTGSSVPGGMTLSAAGVLGGKPTADGVTNFSVTVTDSAKATATLSLSLTVKKGVSITTAAALPDGYVGASYSKTFAAAGGSETGYTWAVESGSSLPGGLTLTAGGVLSGKPTAVGAASFSITVTDSAQNSATVQFTSTIKAGLAVTTPNVLPNAILGSSYAVQLSATGGAGSYVWSLPAQPALRPNARRMALGVGLPSGLNLSADGWITGTPTAAGTSTVTIVVTDAASNSVALDFTITIDGGITITTASTLPGGHPGDLYSQTFTAAGGSGIGYTWSSDAVPGGLQLSPEGILSGYLPATKTYTFDVTVEDSELNIASGTFTLTVTNELRFATASQLPKAYAGTNYTTTLRAKGGSGSGYSFTLSPGSSLPAGLALSTSGSLSGTPTGSGTYDFKATVKDSGKNTAEGSFTLTVVAPVTITSAATLPWANVGQVYTQNINVTGGSGSGYLWTLTSGGSSLSAVGLRFANGVVSGTPTAIGTATFAVSVTDDSLTHDARTFTIKVYPNTPGNQVSGQITLGNACGVTSIPAITLMIDGNSAKAVTSDSDGKYRFDGIPDGNHTITPSIAGADSIFSPETLPITVSGASVTDQNIVVSLAYKVSGTVSYGGPERGQIYIGLINKNCGGDPLGTSISAPGTFTVEGVPPGSYTLVAGIDSLGFGYQNDADAAGVAASDVTVGAADVTGTTITLTNPSQSTLATGPKIEAITANDSGVMIRFEPITGPNSIFNQVELATGYEVQWATQAFPTQASGSKLFAAGGSNGTGVLMLEDANLLPGVTYYFRMRGVNQAGNGAWTNFAGSLAVAAPDGNRVSGSVTFDQDPSGPLYVGFYDRTNGKIYSTRIDNPVSPQGFDLEVPDGDSYFQFAVLDQNNDGMIDHGDVSNTHDGSTSLVGIHGDTQGQDLTLDGLNSTAAVTTQHLRSTNPDNTVADTYSLEFQVKEGNQLPVSVKLIAGPHVLQPVDLGKCLDCGNNQFRYRVNLIGAPPAAGDSYDLLITYSDGSSETVTVQVADVLNAFATGLSPSGTGDTSLTPTFTWMDPANPDSYLYQFSITDNQGSPIWRIPGASSSSSGFDSQTTSITWGTDPKDANNTPNPTSLTQGTTYRWSVVLMDASGDTSEQRTWYKP
jgi:Putative Ig domain